MPVTQKNKHQIKWEAIKRQNKEEFVLYDY